MPKCLFADDDAPLRDCIVDWLKHHNFEVDKVSDGQECKEHLMANKYDLLILDWRMPYMSGLEVCRWFRANDGDTPILMLTGKDEIEDKIAAFDAGADDYLTKPFEVRELIARSKALLRRGAVAPTRVTHVGPVKIYPEQHRVEVGGNLLKLTATEFSILEHLCRNPQIVFSPVALLGAVWNSLAEVSPDTVRVYIRRLREKLATTGYPHLIQNIHGVGYKLDVPETRATAS